MMKRFITDSHINSFLLTLFLSCLFVAEMAVADVCGQGRGAPPFLSYGVESNLLMMLDNSGSMLDMAYVDADGVRITYDNQGDAVCDSAKSEPTQCFDESYLVDPDSATCPKEIDSDKTYAGYFKRDVWYTWADGDYAGLLDLDIWVPGKAYSAKTFIWTNKLLYYTESGQTSSAAATFSDVSDNWQLVTAWQSTSSYASGDIVTHDGMAFQAKAGITAGGELYDKIGDGSSGWARLDEGAFQEYTSDAVPCGADPSFATSDVQITVFDNLGNKVTSANIDTNSPVSVTCFAAKGNFLNWASASKFDIQKKILTGGKFYNGYEARDGDGDVNNAVTTDAGDDMLISQHRGCAGTSFFKQTTLADGPDGTPGTADDIKLTLRVRGAMDDDYVDADHYDAANIDDDFSTRIDVLGVSIGGVDVSSCQAAIDKMENDGTWDGTGYQNDIDNCLTNAATSERAALNHSLQFCWQLANNKERNINTIEGDCETIYGDGFPPSAITTGHGGYNCFGIYEDGTSTDPTPHDARVGYVGRCRKSEDLASGDIPIPCNPLTNTTDDPPGQSLTHPFRDEYCGVDEWIYKCVGGNFVSNNNGYKCNGEWMIKVTHSDATVGYVLPPVNAWSSNLDGDGDSTNDPASPTNCASGDTGYCECINQAMIDYCGDLKVPEVIDPSDKASNTDDYMNIPGILIDSGVMSQLGIDRPIKVFKAYAEFPLPDGTAGNGEDQSIDRLERPDGPRGVLYSVVRNLRLGVMAFNDNGSAAECPGDPNSSIEKYCPSTNKDGAEVVSPIDLGMYTYVHDNGTTTDTTDDYKVEVWDHYNDLIKGVNAVRATSWTPLAEAMYNAIGYYTQNDSWRLNATDFEVGAGHDPVTNWCQENHILIITEGASTADINSTVAQFAVDHPDGDSDGGCSDGLLGSTYLDDLTNFAQFSDAVEAVEEDHIVAAQALYGETNFMIDGEIRKDITTHIVASGSLDLNADGTPKSADECDPARIIFDAAKQGGTDLIVSADPDELEANLLKVLSGLQNRASAGSAASVISSARGGEGAIYQAIFWPEKKPVGVLNDAYTVDWVGDVHALFIDASGLMHEDTDHNGQFTASDKQITVYYDEDQTVSMACYGSVAPDVNGIPTCDGDSKPLEEVEFLWKAADWLSGADGVMLNTAGNRDQYLSDDKRRYLYTWNDLNNDGIVDHDTEWIGFEDGTVDWAGLTVSSDRSGVPTDFDVATNGEVDDIVKWIRGADRLDPFDIDGDGNLDPPLRSRLTKDKDGNEITWRLGDVIHSTPMTVSTPAEAYHLLYNDFSYAQFFARWRQRRHVIYFGANDGMLHAVNGGFYHADTKSFCRQLNPNYDPLDTTNDNPCFATGPALGAELWGYVPYNQLPHLQCMTQLDYEGDQHKYYVDLRPRIFDVQIFNEEAACTDTKAEDCKHPKGWGTILVGGMRLGGVPVDAKDLEGALVDDPRQFISSYFIFDITDPENPPILLGETTRLLDGMGATNYVDLGHSAAISTMIIMKKYGINDTAEANAYDETDGAHNQWYLVLGSGPHGPDALKGVSDQLPRVGILPLDWLVTSSSTSRSPLRIPDHDPGSVNEGGRFLLDGSTFGFTGAPANGFTGDLITIDGDINPSREDYMADAVYFGTVEESSPGTSWPSGGRLYRLLTRNEGSYTPASGTTEFGRFFGRSITQEWSTPAAWEMTTLINNGQPISASPSVGYDGSNLWVYFGTGRFFDVNDKTDDSQQSYYGIMEPMTVVDSTTMKFLGTTVVAPDPTDHGFPIPTWPNSGATPGDKGLLKTDEIRVAEADTRGTAALSCRDGSSDCLPPVLVTAGTTSFEDLVEYVAGSTTATASADGWYYDFYDQDTNTYRNRERNVGQATLFGEILLFTTYQPYSDPCTPEGESYLYGMYYQTGTAWNRLIFGEPAGKYSSDDIREKYAVGPGLATTPNLHSSSEGDSVKAFLQSSTGEIIPIDHEPDMGKSKSARSGWKVCTP